MDGWMGEAEDIPAKPQRQTQTAWCEISRWLVAGGCETTTKKVETKRKRVAAFATKPSSTCILAICI